jgi:hypothetical protein
LILIEGVVDPAREALRERFREAWERLVREAGVLGNYAGTTEVEELP